MTWPLEMTTADGVLTLPGAGCYALLPPLPDAGVDAWLDSGRAKLGAGGVGWLPADGGLLGNLPGWENLLLSTQWHAPAALPALEARLGAWMPRLGYDGRGTQRLLARQPSRLGEDERRLVGWLRLLLARPRLVLLAGEALPGGAIGARLQPLLDEELAGSALLVVDGNAPTGFLPLSIVAREASVP